MFFFPLNVKQMNHVAGLLTCFLFGFLPIPNEEQWIKHVRKVLWNLQQWICSGFTPDSLFIAGRDNDPATPRNFYVTAKIYKSFYKGNDILW